MRLHNWELTLNLRTIGEVLGAFLLFTSALFGAICLVLLFLGTVVFADGRIPTDIPDEINNGVLVYYVDTLSGEFMTDNYTCASWDTSVSVHLVKHPQYISKSLCTSYVMDE